MLRPIWSCVHRQIGVLAVALCGLLATAAEAQKPIAVVAISPLEEVFGDIQYVTQTAGFPQVGQSATIMARPFSQGLDMKRPIGLVVTLNEQQQPQPLAFVPVTNFQTTLNLLQQQLGPPQDAGNGVKEFQGPQSVFLKEQGGWVFLSQTAAGLQNLPADPSTLIADLDQDYDIGVRLFVQNIPQQFRDMFLEQMKQGMRLGMERQANETDQQYQLRQKMAQVQMQQFDQLVRDLQTLTVGVNINQQAKQISLSAAMAGVPGGKFAAQSNAMKNVKTKFAGFVLPDAAVALVAAAQIPSDQVEQSAAMFQVMRQSALEQIENDQKLPDQAARDAAKQLLNQVMDVLVNTIRSGKMDFAASLALDPKAVHLLAGAHVADGRGIEQAIQQLNQLAAKEPDFPGVQFNVEQQGDVRFHKIAFPIPADEAEAQKLFGPQLDVVMGIAPQSVYLGVGPDAIAQLKEAIAKSQSSSGQLQSASKVTISVEKILAFVAAMADSPQPALQAAVSAVQKTAGDDLVTLEGAPIEGGIRYHITIDEGVVGAIGAAVRGAQQGG